ncbi:MAG TPA: bifunctional 5,10-methylenetetrahydrofolate dehydrogenase/5,10-methenyltetrahydrofolate cyclohydrolase [Candidatus Saccharimonadales bacterium]|nr:bifunctional 5,10-methylenetetrahydrofolate dehydrogenase/5,10-methenyltetrahydrofolate cyclohydrolase [Candidatus Saccharimonadales bacterium]
MAQMLDGKSVRDKIAVELTAQIAKLDQKPELVIFQIGDVAESNTYIGQKIKFGEKIGAVVTLVKLPEDISQAEVIKEVEAKNQDETVNGIIVQLPIPKTLDKEEIIQTIDPKKDVDGQNSKTLKLLMEGKDCFIPATTQGVLTLLEHYKISLAGKHAVIVGRSTLVGKPTALAFLNKDATVTIAHSKTENLKQETRNADILIVAIGKPKMITKEFVKAGQVVIDVGINVVDQSSETRDQRPEKPKLVGDVDFENVKDIVEAITPVPGGVGPMTVASLFQNLLVAYESQNS